jgi:hypothetical protein
MSFKTIRQLTAAAGAGITILPGDLLPVARSTGGANQTLSATVGEVVKEALTDPAVQTQLGATINVINNAAGAGPVTYTTNNPPLIGGQPVFAIPTNTDAGEHLIYEGTAGTNVVNKPFLKKALAGRGSPEVIFNQSAIYISNQDILDGFYRFSHKDTDDHFDTTSTGEDAWVIDANGDLFQDQNTQFATGFASQQSYTGYEARVMLRSNGENDAIGFVIALDTGATQDGAGNWVNGLAGTDRSLSVIRSNAKATHNDGAAYRYGICYNFSKSDESWLAESEASLTTGANNERTWGSIYPNGDALKISRSATQVEVWIATNVATIPPDDDAAWTGYLSIDLTQAANTLTSNLNIATRLNPIPATTMAAFQQPTRWGLIARSQAACSWKELFIAQQGAAFADAATNDLVFDIETNQTFQYDSTTQSWTNVVGTSIGDFVDDGQALFDLGNGTFFFKQKGILQPLFSKRPDFAVQNSDFTASGSMLAQVIRLDAGVTSVGFNGSYGQGWHATFLNCTGGAITINSGGATGLNGGAVGTTLNVPAGQNFRAFGNGLANGAGVSILIG